jgi:hypothetical protein
VRHGDLRERMTDNVVPLGLGPPLADPVSVWPCTTVIELGPEAAERLGSDATAAVRTAIAEMAAVAVEQVADVVATHTGAGSALVRLPTASHAMQALHVGARRRGTSVAEALHAAVLGLE